MKKKKKKDGAKKLHWLEPIFPPPESVPRGNGISQVEIVSDVLAVSFGSRKNGKRFSLLFSLLLFFFVQMGFRGRKNCTATK